MISLLARFFGGRTTPRYAPVYKPITATCADCPPDTSTGEPRPRVVTQTRDGRCGDCGSEAIATRGNCYVAPAVDLAGYQRRRIAEKTRRKFARGAA